MLRRRSVSCFVCRGHQGESFALRWWQFRKAHRSNMFTRHPLYPLHKALHKTFPPMPTEPTVGHQEHTQAIETTEATYGAVPCHGRGREFESRRPRHILKHLAHYAVPAGCN